MKTHLIRSLAALTLSVAFSSVSAQETVPSPNVDGAAHAGVSASAAMGIDFASGQAPGANQEKTGGLAESLEGAFSAPPADCGKLKCD